MCTHKYMMCACICYLVKLLYIYGEKKIRNSLTQIVSLLAFVGPNNIGRAMCLVKQRTNRDEGMQCTGMKRSITLNSHSHAHRENPENEDSSSINKALNGWLWLKIY